MSTENTTDLPLVFTASAAAKVAQLIVEEGKPELMLRVYIQGGGCSGVQYGFTFDESVQDGDTLEVMNGGRAVRIRLAGIDCPEKNQAFGMQAKRFASEQAFGHVWVDFAGQFQAFAVRAESQ